ncbi:MAG: class I SAM-dependent methyltransferase [Gammaproteobacteria bacterium]|nr:class I SAM-dependent methyltransferase [Gammaproteobacteria bacterium]
MHTQFAEERIDKNKVNEFTYASRKLPEFMCLRLVRCSDCDLVYAPTPPDSKYLFDAYTDAAYDSSEEAQCAANSYARALTPFLSRLTSRGAAVDVGAGSGPLLPWLLAEKFHPVIGIEPSIAAIDAATDSVRPLLRKGMFSSTLLEDVTPTLICSFMTLEHIDDPASFVNNAYDKLEPGGMIAVVVHNWQGLLNRILGLRSPIIDVEHLQLFNPGSVSRLLKNSGFEAIEVIAISNTYPLKYWLRLMPLPSAVKNVIERILEKLYVSNMKLPMRVGNILAVGIKPDQEL